MNMIKKLDTIENRDTIQHELEKIETLGQLQELLAAHGVQLTEDEVKELMEEAVRLNGELKDDDLDNVAGGIAPAVGAAVCVTGWWALKTIASWAIDKILTKATGW